VTTFVLRENNLWNSKDDLNESNAVLISVGIPPTALAPTLQPVQVPAEKLSCLAASCRVHCPDPAFSVVVGLQKKIRGLSKQATVTFQK